ncbi:MAG: mobile mystery protein A [Acidobacteriaceae bacterium]|jgi:predicted DNA-binding mobile mystery protein A|nr:mobile mystery protein A [Acidobacteriaceae bacterium]
MKKARVAAHSRSRLDERLGQFGATTRYHPPARGWIKAIREALGMSTAQLAQRMGVRQPTLVGLERSEERGSISLTTLQRAALALDCTLVYALIPNTPLDTTVRARARTWLRRHRQPVAHTMLLEDQQADDHITDAQIDDLLRDTNPHVFWE